MKCEACEQETSIPYAYHGKNYCYVCYGRVARPDSLPDPREHKVEPDVPEPCEQGPTFSTGEQSRVDFGTITGVRFKPQERTEVPAADITFTSPEYVEPAPIRDPERGETEVERLTRERDEWRDRALRAEGQPVVRPLGRMFDAITNLEDRLRDANLRRVFGTASVDEGE